MPLVFPNDGGAQVWRDFNIDGNSLSGNKKPVKLEIRELTTFYEDTLDDHEDRIVDLEDAPAPSSATGNAAIVRNLKTAIANHTVNGTTYAIRPVSLAHAGVGGVTLSASPSQLWSTVYPQGYNDDVVVVDVNNGDDTTGDGSFATPYATYSKAIRDVAASTVILFPGVYEPVSLIKGTHAGAVGFRRVIAPYGGVIFRYSGAGIDPQSATWTATVGSGGLVYELDCSALGAAQFPARVLRLTRTDRWGKPERFTVYESVAELVALGSASLGFYYDPAVEKLYVNYLGLNVESSKAQLDVLWTDSAGNTRIFHQGVFVMYQGEFLFYGVGFETVDDGALTDSWLYMDGGDKWIDIFGTNQAGIRVQGGVLFANRLRIHATTLDGINGNPSSDSLQGLIVLNNFVISKAGDSTTFGTDEDQNRQAISAHGGCHIVACGGVCAESWGQDIADTNTTGYDSVSMYFGVVCQDGEIPLSTGFGAYDIGDGSRTMYLDNCQTDGEDVSLEASGAAVYTFNCLFDGLTSTNAGGTVTAYLDPSSPP